MRGAHHLHIRKRATGSLEPFPARTAWKRFLDRLVVFIGVLGPFMAIPQLAKVYLDGDATGVSAFSWGMWALLDIPWIAYGFTHRVRPIISTYTLWFIVNALVCIGALMHGSL